MKNFVDKVLGVTSEHQFRCQLKTRKLVWLLAFMFASLLLAEYLEIPYGYVISSLLSAAKRNFNSTSTSNVLDVTSIAMSPEVETSHQMNNSEVGKNNGGFTVDVAAASMSPEVQVTPQENHTVLEKSQDMKPEVEKNQTGYAPLPSVDPPLPSFPNSTASGKNAGIPPSVDPPLPSIPNSTELGNNAGIPPSVDPPLPSIPNSTALAKNEGITPVNHISPNNTMHYDSVPSGSPSAPQAPAPKRRDKKPMATVVSISEMHNILLENRQVPSLSMKSLWRSPADEELLHAKSEIRNAPPRGDNQGLYPAVYRNISTFIRSYELMEQMLKVYIYKEGNKPVFHQPRLTGIYASEGWFLKLLESSKHFVTNKPEEAHLFYLPFTTQMLEESLYVPNSHSFDNLVQYLKDYLELINTRYSFWNRTSGSDHFLVGCHDWAPFETKRVMTACIRAICNADLKEGFQLGKDVSLPETLINSAQDPSKDIGGKPPSERNILAFFAGQMHGYVRPILLKHWLDKDPDMHIFGKMRGNDYSRHMRSSKYCICPRGYEVNSPRVVEAIMHECVPVIISDNFVPPFFEILNWQSFAFFVAEKDIPDLKKILLSISERRYRVMQYRVRKVRQHFLWHVSPEKYDVFHMILHSIWYNRVFQMNS
ncbi:hypothetical protein Leryth_021356 [Lithospermum erythrorhizon]|nr:hypothetical protein Leryth_021356 [Lithospermum erythrorhizon]